ncbi:MAG: branched-chain amino acid ABC transporter permease [Deltaproteobacteria bacterium]|nr:branched-chain amino acid ABC transporter permease [Deltaproteobacteria bacterium]
MKKHLLLNRIRGQRLFWSVATVIFFLVLPRIISLGYLSLVIEMMILGVAACGLNLIMGYAGMVSFGPAGLYATGAYATALLIVKFGVPFGWAMIAGPIAAALAGVLIGWFCVRRTAVYFALLTLAFSQIIYTIVFEWYSFTGGDNGIVGIKTPGILSGIESYYYFTLTASAVCVGLMWMIANSSFGKALQAIRENPERAEFIAIHVRRYQLAAFVLSSFFLGAAGSLYCGFNHNVFPVYAHWSKGADILVVCLLGGMFHFMGPILGSVVYILLDKIIVSFTEYWPMVLGLIVVLSVLFLRGGIAGFLSSRLLYKPEGERGGDR